MPDDPVPRAGPVWRDLAVVLAATLVFAALSIRFELSERVFYWTRLREGYQLDELPGVLLVLASAFAWFAWRRMRELGIELARRREAEQRLVDAFADNQRLARASVLIQEEERRALARELHDELGQFLNAIKIDAVCIRDVTDGETRQSALSIIASVDRVQRTVVGIVRKLRPPGLDELGLTAALESCVDGWRRRLPSTRFDLVAPLECADWGEAVNMTLYRVVQESLTNVAKHAQARHVKISLEVPRDEVGERRVVLRIHDDGVGSSREASAGGLGLLGMRERLSVLGGRLDIRRQAGRGFCLEATVPAPAARV